MIKKNEINFGDCFELMDEIEEESIDLILCDLPYGVTRNKWDSVLNLKNLWSKYEKIIKPSGAIVLTGQDKFSARLMLSNEKIHRYNLVWEKTYPTGFLNANKMPLRNHEDILVFYKSLPTYNPQKTYGHKRSVSKAVHKSNSKKTPNYGMHFFTPYDSTERHPKSVIKFSSDKQTSSIHPTQKPVALFEYIIKTYTNRGDLVLDNCSGSGTTAIACLNTGREYICIENDKEYFEKSITRIMEHKEKSNQLTIGLL